LISVARENVADLLGCQTLSIHEGPRPTLICGQCDQERNRTGPAFIFEEFNRPRVWHKRIEANAVVELLPRRGRFEVRIPDALSSQRIEVACQILGVQLG
jgi:hypothetical protein